MTNEKVMQLIREAYERKLTELDLSNNQITQIPPEITELKSLTTLNLSGNQLTQLPPEITELKNLTELDLSNNQLIQLPLEIGELENLTELDLSGNQLTQLPPEITELKILTTLNLSFNHFTQLSSEIAKLKNLTTLDLCKNHFTQLLPEIAKLKNLTTLDLCENHLTQLPPEIIELKNLTTLDLSFNHFIQLPSEITELKNLTELNLSGNQLTQLLPEITELKNLTTLDLSENRLTQLLPEIIELKSLTTLDLSGNQLTQLPPEIAELENLTELNLYGTQLTQLPSEITKLKNLTELNLARNQLTQLPPEIIELKTLTTLYLFGNQLTQLPPKIAELENLTELELSENQLTQLPPEITKLKNLTRLYLSKNPLISPTPEIASMGVKAIFTYLKQPKNSGHNEAKLILVGDGEVGKTCLANRLINDIFLEDQITKGIKRSEWSIPAPGSGNSSIKLNIWDFGGQEIYHSTHQFFLTERSIYLLVWNARKKTTDYNNDIYYWLHTIEAFGKDSPIILVMSKMNESDDDLNMKDLRSKFPQIKGDLIKIDSEDGKGISVLKEKIRETAWNLPLMRNPWIDSWYRVRKRLEELNKNCIAYNEFYKLCISEGLDDRNICILDKNLHELGVTLHFKDRIALKNIVILKPEWATGAFYKILSAKSVLQREGLVLHNELDEIWDKEIYPPEIYPQLIELMNKFELAYQLPDKTSYLIAELLPKNEPDNFEWDAKDDLCFYYCYDYFLPPGIITRFIVRMHQNIEKKENGMPLCWRKGAVLDLQYSRALVKMKPDEKQIEIRITGDNKRGALGAICNELDQINASIKKINISKKIPCNCSENCSKKYSYEELLKVEMNNVKFITCLKSCKPVSVSLLLDGYTRKDERFKAYSENYRSTTVYNYGGLIMSKDNIHIEHVVGSVNVKSRLDHVTQTVNNAPALTESKKQELTDLLQKLTEALEYAASAKPEETEDVTQFVESVASEVSKEKPNKSILKSLTDGLEKAAKTVEDIAPSVLTIATSIAKVAGMI